MSDTRLGGVIKFYNEDKGFGFITPDAGGDDVFFHTTEACEHLNKVEDQRVSFVEGSNPKDGRIMALDVKSCEGGACANGGTEEYSGMGEDTGL